MADAKSKLIIQAENQTEAAFRQVRKSMGDVETAGRRLTSTLAGLGVGISLAAVIRDTGRAVLEAEQSEARLDATLKATGNTSGFARQKLEELNAELVKTSQFDDEGIRNAQAQLVKFGNISGEQFSRSLKLAADYAVLLGTDIPDAAQQLGRALTAPNVGLTFLERNVGKFSDETHAAIDAMIRLGDTSGAQTRILDELQKRIGGTAGAANIGLTKATSDLKRSWDDMLEAWGRTPAVGGLVQKTIEGIARAFKGLTPDNSVAAELNIIEQSIARIKKETEGSTVKPFQLKELEARRDALLEVQRLEQRQNEILQRQAEASAKQAQEVTKREAARKAAEDAAAKALKGRLTAEQIAMKQQEGQEELARQAAEFDKYASEQQQKALQDRLKMQQQVSDSQVAAAQSQIDDYEETLRLEAERQDALRKTDDAAKELGFTFQSAFEDAILNGEKFSDVLKAIEKDIARIIIRKSITEPLGNALAGAVSKGIGSAFGGAKAGGGDVFSGKAYLVGEQGPELFFPGRSGTIQPNGAGGVTINQGPVTISGSGVTMSQVRQALAAQHRQTIAAVQEIQRR